MRLLNFIKKNRHKKLTIKAYLYSAFFRFQILTRESSKLHKKWGIKGEETSTEELTSEQRKSAAAVSYSVNRVCNKTKWESKCLVRALTAQKLLKELGLSSTLYLGCGMQDEKMVAHAWIRSGNSYITGGNGKEYAVVETFAVY